MGRHGLPRAVKHKFMSHISCLNFRIVKIPLTFGAPGPGPGPGLAQGPDLGQKLAQHSNISLGLVPNGPKWVYIRWDPLITY